MHGPAAKLGVDNASPAKAKLGVFLFFVYLFVYSGFVAVTLFSLKSMNMKVLMGMNLACFYGFGLIILAIIMGLIYNHICTGLEKKLNKPEEEQKTEETSG